MWRTFQYLRHLLYLRHRKGFGIHSPCVFDWVHRVVFNADRIGVPEEIRSVHRELRKERLRIGKKGEAVPGAGSSAYGAGAVDYGAGPRVDRADSRTVGSFARHSSVSPKYGALLYRISRWFQPDHILELGTGLGISALYLAAGSPGIPLQTVEGNRERADFSSDLIKRCGFPGVKVHVGEMGQVLEEMPPLEGNRLLAFVDGNHRFEPTVRYMKWIVERAGPISAGESGDMAGHASGREEGKRAGRVPGREAVVVMDDIYWSREMGQAWKEVISWPEVRVSIDLFHMGILLLRKDLSKTDLKIKF